MNEVDLFECVVHPNKHLVEGIMISSQILELTKMDLCWVA